MSEESADYGVSADVRRQTAEGQLYNFDGIAVHPGGYVQLADADVERIAQRVVELLRAEQRRAMLPQIRWH